MKAASRKRAPTTVKRTVRRGRRPNGHYRTREYLTEKEVERLMKAAGRNRYGHRDATMILLAFRLAGNRSTSPTPGCTSLGSSLQALEINAPPPLRSSQPAQFRIHFINRLFEFAGFLFRHGANDIGGCRAKRDCR